jgi:hypothetical protein
MQASIRLVHNAPGRRCAARGLARALLLDLIVQNIPQAIYYLRLRC